MGQDASQQRQQDPGLSPVWGSIVMDLRFGMGECRSKIIQTSSDLECLRDSECRASSQNLAAYLAGEAG